MQFTQYAILGPSRSGKTTFVKQILDQSDADDIRITTGGRSVSKVISDLTATLINAKSDNLNVVLDELNYGAYPTHQLEAIIRESLELILKINSQRETPLVANLYWIGTRNTLIKLIIDRLTSQLMDADGPLDAFTAKITENIEGFNVMDAIDNNVNYNDDPFVAYQIDTNY